MASQSIEYTRRQISRAKETAEKALAPTGQSVVLRAMAPELIRLATAFEQADAADRGAETSVGKEVSEGEQALAALRKSYDPIRELLALKNASSYEAASVFRTPDDFLHAAEEMEQELGGSDAAWAGPVLAELGPLLDAASKESMEASESRKTQQKTALTREQREGELRPVFVRFRRTVRTTFGSSSREYRELLDRRSRSGPDDEGNGGGGS